ncbi:MAG: DUF4917 family protein [Inquilinus sp.]|nr:DUF4917 family protein [Inquilinus sp.]
MCELISYGDALAETRAEVRHVLIGNGFSRAQSEDDRFAYSSLLEKSGLPDDHPIRNVFQQLNTVDFEAVVRALEHAALVEGAYGEDERARALGADATQLREALIHAVREVHPGIRFDVPEQQQTACAEFLSNYSKVFTLNYDLLLYWVVLHGARDHHSDGFGLGEANGGFRKFSEDAHCSVYFLHGALHLFLDQQQDTEKRIVTGATIIDDITDTIRTGQRLPLFVAEGTSGQKQRKINSVPYLRYCYDQLGELEGSLFVLGHSADENDRHVYSAIENSDVERLYFFVHEPEDNLATIREKLAVFRERNRNVAVQYIDAAEANVWGRQA